MIMHSVTIIILLYSSPVFRDTLASGFVGITELKFFVFFRIRTSKIIALFFGYSKSFQVSLKPLFESNPQYPTLTAVCKKNPTHPEVQRLGKPNVVNLPSLPVQESLFCEAQVKGFGTPFRVPHDEKELGANSWATCWGHSWVGGTLASCPLYSLSTGTEDKKLQS
ncbi:hypothetical protein NPIL_534071 [Nephila pilipes]|uniref:Uncharacterized protein n=1 Tax=Nephila pilipes TaxID=299642 RepID=A0A8X6TVH9_NEPPI|nr:hypothetical protein NPIL_534071 [Nephila pilipes]